MFAEAQIDHILAYSRGELSITEIVEIINNCKDELNEVEKQRKILNSKERELKNKIKDEIKKTKHKA